MNALLADHLTFSYEGTTVLKDISFIIAPGEFIGVIGPNGGGKTTLLYLLMGFLKPDKGTIRIFDKSPKEARKKIGWVPQTFRYDPHFPISVLEVVLTGRLQNATWYGTYRKADYFAAKESLEKMGMLSFSKACFSELSGGEAQRVLLARALATHPSILLLDEPTASIDVAMKGDIYQALASLKGTITILMVTHDLKGALDHVERVFCIQGTLSIFSRDEVCRHFALGLYHPPLRRDKE